MANIQNPCENCKKKGNCPSPCYPKRDYQRAVLKITKKEVKKNGRVWKVLLA